jgi:hypothetical protein
MELVNEVRKKFALVDPGNEPDLRTFNGFGVKLFGYMPDAIIETTIKHEGNIIKWPVTVSFQIAWVCALWFPLIPYHIYAFQYQGNDRILVFGRMKYLTAFKHFGVSRFVLFFLSSYLYPILFWGAIFAIGLVVDRWKK